MLNLLLEPDDSSLSNTRRPNEQQRTPILNQIPQHISTSGHCPPNPTSKPHDASLPVADCTDPVQSPADPRPIIRCKITHLRNQTT